MPKVQRDLFADGELHEVSHAVCADLTCPSREAFEQMSRGEWAEDPDLADIPDDAQISSAQKFKVGIEFFAEYGYPNNRYCTVNNLNDGVWEFRLGAVRISFFDTDGNGNYEAKTRIGDVRDSPYDGDFWWLPDFDEYIRLGHCFGKTTQRTEQEDLDETLRVREEDLEHDRA